MIRLADYIVQTLADGGVRPLSSPARLSKPSLPLRKSSSIQPLNTSTPQLPARYVPSVRRAQSELDLHSWTAVKDAINKTRAWHQLQ